METSSVPPVEKRLSVIYRVEPGCLGPEGSSHIEGFCRFAQTAIETIEADYVHWDIIPRYDKTLSEMQFNVLGKKISQSQASKYLQVYGRNLDELESHLGDKLSELITLFMSK